MQDILIWRLDRSVSDTIEDFTQVIDETWLTLAQRCALFCHGHRLLFLGLSELEHGLCVTVMDPWQHRLPFFLRMVCPDLVFCDRFLPVMLQTLNRLLVVIVFLEVEKVHRFLPCTRTGQLSV